MQVMNSTNITQVPSFGTAKLPSHIKKAHKLSRAASSSLNKFDKNCSKFGKSLVTVAKTLYKSVISFGKTIYYAGKAVVQKAASKILEHKDIFKI